ncbi:MAG: 5'-3' exonuclease, partial [Gammaproteobacteria bacterium]
MGNTLYLLDGSSYAYRAHYALPPLKTKNGFPTGAIFGFLRMLLAILKEKKPAYAGVVFDTPKKTFRKKLFENYKAQRRKAPDELKRQLPVIKELVGLLGIPTLEVEGFEADDVIATLCKEFSQKGWQIVVYTPDKDMAQLLSLKGVRLINPLNGEEITPQKVEEKFGVKPHQIPSYLALVGDKSDNIPGVEGIGPKKAKEILEKYDTVDKLITEWENLPPALKRYFSSTSKEELKKWLSLTQLRFDVPLQVTPESLKVKKPDFGKLKE